MRKSILLLVSVFMAGLMTASAQDTLPRKIENPQLYDLEGNVAEIPHWGEKNLLIFFVDPDSYLAGNANKKFAAEAEDNQRAAGPNIYGLGVINTADTKLPKNLVRTITRKRCEKSGALSLDDKFGTLSKSWGLGDCNGRFIILIVSKEGELVYVQKDEFTPESKAAFYDFVNAYR